MKKSTIALVCVFLAFFINMCLCNVNNFALTFLCLVALVASALWYGITTTEDTYKQVIKEQDEKIQDLSKDCNTLKLENLTLKSESSTTKPKAKAKVKKD